MAAQQWAMDAMEQDRVSTDAAVFFNAVQKAIDEKGLERVTQDDIIRHSGVPRTTLYRRYGSRDEILKAFVLDRTSADIAECQRLASGAGSFSERFEEILVFAIMAVHRHGWLHRELDRGSSGGVQAILADAFELSSEQTLVPFLTRAKAQGLCRCPAPLEELRRWLLYQIFNLSRQQYASKDEARRMVRTYVLPVLALDDAILATNDKIDFIYRHVKEIAGK